MDRRNFLKTGGIALLGSLATGSAMALTTPGALGGEGADKKAAVALAMNHFGVSEADLKKVLAAALEKGGDYADLFFEHTISNSIRLMDGAVNNSYSNIDYGVGVRVLTGDQSGYAYVENITVEDMLKAARTAARIASANKGNKPLNLILKKDDQSNHTHIHQGIEYGAQQFHLQNLSDHQPDQDKNQNAGKNLDRAGGLHQFVGVVQQKGDQQYIDKIFYANVKKHGTYYLLQVINSQTTREYHQRIMPFYHLPYSLSVLSLSTIRTASTASRTSCTRRMFAPFINATVSSTVVPFNESCGVPPNSL